MFKIDLAHDAYYMRKPRLTLVAKSYIKAKHQEDESRFFAFVVLYNLKDNVLVSFCGVTSQGLYCFC